MSLPDVGDVLLDKYELEWELGRGGYGVVFKARTVSTGRPVAVKILKPSKRDESPRAEERFRREMTAVAQLQCPHTMTLYDFGRAEDGQLIMVCEYIEGTDLIELIVRRGTIKESRVLDILRQVLMSLSEAHDLGILHRDIKPANIRVQLRENKRLRAKLLDFGLTVRLESDDARLTGTGLVVGTPRYMSPEQIRGTDVGPASDIYSLGVVMIEALLGRGSVRVGEIVELPEDCGVNPVLMAVLNRMVEPDPRRRYQTAADVLVDLPRRLTPGQPVLPTSFERVDPLEEKTTTAFRALSDPHARRRWPLLLLGVLVAALAVLGVSVFSEPSEDVRRPPQGSPPQLSTPEPVVAAGVAANPSHVKDQSDGLGCANMPVLEPGVHQLLAEGPLMKDKVWVYLPPGYDRSRRHRIILVFTDVQRTGEDAIRMVARQPANPDLEPFVVISGLSVGELWVTAQDQMQTGWKRVMALSNQLCIDPDSVFVLGHGAGGAPVLREMCSFPVLAAATVGFRIRTNDEVCKHPTVPLLNIEVDNNPYAPVEGGIPCTMPVEVRSLESQDYVLRREFGCSSDVEEVTRADGSTCWTSSCRVPFESCLVEGGRDWAGTPPLESKCRSVPGDYDFRGRLWRFFSAAEPLHPR